MTLNPITALSEQLQKLINEHGSAAILRDHLALFKDQLVISEKKFAVLETENVGLKSKIKTLESQLQNATKEIERQKQVIKALQGSQSTKKYNEITEKVINLFFNAGRELPVNYIATSLAIDINTALYHFDILLKDKLITQTMAGSESSWTGTSDPDMFDLTPAGRKYVVEHKTS